MISSEIKAVENASEKLIEAGARRIMLPVGGVFIQVNDSKLN